MSLDRPIKSYFLDPLKLVVPVPAMMSPLSLRVQALRLIDIVAPSCILAPQCCPQVIFNFNFTPLGQGRWVVSVTPGKQNMWVKGKDRWVWLFLGVPPCRRWVWWLVGGCGD